MIKFLADYPVAFISGKKILVIADIHLGIENELYNKGILIHPQVEKFRKILEELIDQNRAKTLVILGDLKHNVPGISLREERQIPKLFDSLVEKVKVILCKGNHDTELKGLLPEKVKIYSSRGFQNGEYGFFHGHAWPDKNLMKCNYLFMGHLQPAIEFVDKLGYRSIQQVWLKGNLNQNLIKKKYKISKTGELSIIIVPSFNKLSGSLIVNKKLKEELTGPLFTNKILDMDKMTAYLLDGTCLGKVGEI
jgi:putative SbcD/Mre11-related phosphoesterase